MKLSPLFKLRTVATPALVNLLNAVTLGTNGAKYRHLNTEERIHNADNPLHLSVERNNSILGNASFCRRKNDWYVRYFAFNAAFQGRGQKRSKGKNGFLKREMEHLFCELLDGKTEFGKVDSFYAYIDPNNEKSLWMSENFGFEKKARIATQTFSRAKPKRKQRVELSTNWEEVKPLFRKQYSEFYYFTEEHLRNGPFYILRNPEGEIVAAAKYYKAKWKIERLPGNFGGILTKLVPYLPTLRKIIKPKNHSFLVPEAVVLRENDPRLLKELFEGMLAHENENLILWWTDEDNPVYQSVKNDVKWGTLHKLIGINYVDVVVRESKKSNFDKSKPVYTCGFDFI